MGAVENIKEVADTAFKKVQRHRIEPPYLESRERSA